MKQTVLSVLMALSFTIVYAQLKIGDMAPEIRLKNLAEKEIALSDLKGSYVFLDFF